MHSQARRGTADPGQLAHTLTAVDFKIATTLCACNNQTDLVHLQTQLTGVSIRDSHSQGPIATPTPPAHLLSATYNYL